MQSYWQNIRLMTRQNWSYIISWSIVSLAQAGFTAVLFNLYLQRMGLSKAEIGAFLGAGSLVLGISAMPAGYIGARITPRRAFTIGLAIPVPGWILVLLVPLLPEAIRLAAMYAGWITVYLGTALYLVNGAPYGYQITNERNRIFIISFQQFIQGVMGAGGSLVAGVMPGLLMGIAGNTLSTLASYQIVLFLVPALYAVASFSMWRTPPVVGVPAPSGRPDGPLQPTFPTGVFVYFFSIVMLMATASVGFNSFFNLFLNDLGYSTGQIGSWMGITQIMPFLSAGTVPLLNRRLNLAGLFGLGSLILSGFVLLLSFDHQPGVIFICLAMCGYALAIYNNVRQMYGQQLVDPRWRTYMSAGSSIGLALGGALIATVGGAVIDTSGFPVLFRISSAAALASGVVILVYPRLAAFQARKAQVQAK